MAVVTITTASLAPAQKVEASATAITIGALLGGLAAMYGVVIKNNSNVTNDFVDFVADSGASDTLKSIITRGVNGTLFSMCISDEMMALVKLWLLHKGFELVEGVVDSASNIFLNALTASGNVYCNSATPDLLTKTYNDYKNIGKDKSKPYFKYAYNSLDGSKSICKYFTDLSSANRYYSDGRIFVMAFCNTPDSTGEYAMESFVFNSDGTYRGSTWALGYYGSYAYSNGSYEGGKTHFNGFREFIPTSQNACFETNIPFVVINGSSYGSVRYSELRFLLEDAYASYNFDSVTYDIGANTGSYDKANVDSAVGMTFTQADLSAIATTVNSTLDANENDDNSYVGNIASLVASAVSAKLEAIQLENDTTNKIEDAENAEQEAIANGALLDNAKEQTGLLSSIVGFLQNILDRLIPIDTWGEWMSSLVSGIGDVVSGIGTVVSNLVSIDTWTGWFADIKQGFLDIGANIGQAVLDLVDSVVGIFVPDMVVVEASMDDLIDDLKYKFNFTSSLNSIKGMFDNERPVQDIEADYTIYRLGTFHFTFLDTSYLVQGISYFRSVIRGFLVFLLALFHVRQFLSFINQDAVTRGEIQQDYSQPRLGG